MGYKNNQTGYPKDLLASRAVIERGNFALVPENGLVKNVIPGFEGCDVTILSSPKLGASFVDYIAAVAPGGGNRAGFGGDGVESFLFVQEGALAVTAGGEQANLATGGYVYCPPTAKLTFANEGGETARIFLYKRRYKAVEGIAAPGAVVGNIHESAPYCYEDMDNVLIQDLLPKDLAFDMNIHILTFKPGASHGYIETHIQEHGALVLTGEGMYNLDNHWIPVKQGDYLFMGAYSLQAAYGVGTGDFSYIYSKDCNRDEEI